MPRPLIVAALATALTAPPAHAQPNGHTPATASGEAARKDRARELAREGAALFRGGDRRAAVAKFEEAYAIYPSPVLLYNLGKAYAGLSADARAHRLLTRFLREAAPGDVAPERRAEVEQLLADLGARVAVATITAPRFEGATLEIDGAAFGAAPLPDPLALDPGVHEITARRGETLVARKRVTLVAGGRPAIVLERVEDDLEKVFVTREVPSRPIYKRWWFWTAIAASAASTAAIWIATHPREDNEVGDPTLGSWSLDDFDDGR